MDTVVWSHVLLTCHRVEWGAEMRSAYETLKFDWLCTPAEKEAVVLRPWDGDVAIHYYPVPEEIGQGNITRLELAMGMTIFRAEHRFGQAGFGKLVEIAEVEGKFPSISLMIQIARGSRIIHYESIPVENVIFSPGHDLFRLADRLKVRPVVDASADSVMTSLIIGLQTLEILIGKASVERTLDALGLLPAPRVLIQPIPMSVSDILHTVIPTGLSGAIQRLTAQSRTLQYLTALISHLGTDSEEALSLSASQRRARELHALLQNAEGKIPTLSELGERFSKSARTLSNDFQMEYGQSIAAFVSDRRLQAAHAAIAKSNTPLKAIAERLGYIHTNHFVRAFSKKFGYPPGSLRKWPAREP
jgi:AraC-like DNA-binding protein